MGKVDGHLVAIRAARTHTELDHAMDHYREQLGMVYPELRANYALNAALQQRRYFQALALVPRGGRAARRYLRLAQVLEQACDKQFSLAKGLAA
jgi:hypothetical protein